MRPNRRRGWLSRPAASSAGWFRGRVWFRTKRARPTGGAACERNLRTSILTWKSAVRRSPNWPTAGQTLESCAGRAQTAPAHGVRIGWMARRYGVADEDQWESARLNESPATAFLIIDAQCGLLDGEAAVPDAERVLERLAILLAAARSAGSLVIHLQNDGPSGAVDEPGKPGWFIHPRA